MNGGAVVDGFISL